MDDFKDFLFTIDLVRLVREAKEAPDEKLHDYLNQIISKCYAHEMVKALKGCPSSLIVCAVTRAFLIAYNDDDFKDIHGKFTAILNVTLKECMNDLEAADKADKA